MGQERRDTPRDSIVGEPAKRFDIGPRRRYAEARLNIFGKARVKRGRERNPAPHAIAPCGKPQRSLGRDVNGFWPELVDDAPDRASREQGKLNLRIGRHRHRAKPVRRHEPHLVTQAPELRAERLKRAYYAVDLRRPCVGRDQNPHEPPRRKELMRAVRLKRVDAAGAAERFEARESTAQFAVFPHSLQRARDRFPLNPQGEETSHYAAPQYRGYPPAQSEK